MAIGSPLRPVAGKYIERNIEQTGRFNVGRKGVSVIDPGVVAHSRASPDFSVGIAVRLMPPL